MKRKKNPTSFLFATEFEREDDGRWIAEIPKLPGAMAYGINKKDAARRAYSIALRILADNIEQGKTPAFISQFFGHELARR